jgi:hypothetical protein
MLWNDAGHCIPARGAARKIADLETFLVVTKAPQSLREEDVQ